MIFACAKSQHPNKVTPHIERFYEGITNPHSMLEKSKQVRFDVPPGFEKDRGLHDTIESNLQEIDKGLHDYDSSEGKFIAKEFILKQDSFPFNPYPPSHVHTVPSPLVDGKGPSSSPTDLDIPLVALTDISKRSKLKIKNSQRSGPSWKRLVQMDLTEKSIGASISGRKCGVSVDENCLELLIKKRLVSLGIRENSNILAAIVSQRFQDQRVFFVGIVVGS